MPNTSNQNDLGYSPDALAQRKAELLSLLSQTAPEVLSDNQQINVNKLKELLGEEHITGDEHYELSWAGKAAARREIQKTSSHTLLPDPSNAVNAQHMLIEGENLEVLRVLQKSYYGKVKIIYIDPPYNTGNDSFVYPDDYSETLDEYQKRIGEKNEAGYLNKQSLWKKNSKESGQYHSAWLSMMYPRLYLARNLLRDDGVIFISIDDNEASNLKVLCDEVFGSENHLATLVWKKKYTGGKHTKGYVDLHEYIQVYAKSSSNLDSISIDRPDDEKGKFAESDEFENSRGKFYVRPLKSNLALRKTLIYPITAPDGSILETQWLVAKDTFLKMLEEKRVEFRKKQNGQYQIYRKYYEKDGDGTVKPPSLIDKHPNTEAKIELKEIFGITEGRDNIFYTVKPVGLIKNLLAPFSEKNDLVLDFFGGSGTTTHAVMEMNLEDGGERQSICVQIPEPIDEASEAYKTGYRTISDITRARIGKVITKLKGEHPDNTTDLACAKFALAPSNFKIWRSDVIDENALRDQLALFQSVEKGGKSAKAVEVQTAMLSELVLKHGLGALGVHAISESKQMAGVTVHRVLMEDDRRLWVCFDTYTEALKDEIVKARPAQVILLNSCFVGDKADELLSNLQLELSGLDIGLTVI